MKMFLVLVAVVTGSCFAEPNISVTVDGSTYQCSGGGTGGGCKNQPATLRCDNWDYQGVVKVKNPYYQCPDAKVACADFHSYERVCRTFDGCGNLSGQYQEKMSEGTGWQQECKPCS